MREVPLHSVHDGVLRDARAKLAARPAELKVQGYLA